jgi:D-hydroxyproline dehydrogenase subunit alpha
MPRSVIVIGAGPAGMAAATEAVDHGCKVTVIDEAARPGGQIYRQSHPSLRARDWSEARERARKYRLLQRFGEIVPRIDYLPGAEVFALFPGWQVHVAQAEATHLLTADAVVLATGVRERTIPFPGWTTPGVMFAGGAQAILKSHQVLPGRRAVVAGCGPLPIVVAGQLARAGAKVAALAPLHPIRRMLRHPGALWHGRDIVLEGTRYLATAIRRGMSLLAGWTPLRAVGSGHLESVVLGRIGVDGQIIDGSEREIACDLLAINYGFLANSELAAMSGAEMRHEPISGWIAYADAFGRTSMPGLFVAGDVAGLRGALVAEADGRIVGFAAATGSDRADRIDAEPALQEAVRVRQRYTTLQTAIRETLQVPLSLWKQVGDETVVCRCENVTCAEIRGALEGGHTSLNAIKRQVRAGMGWCGGRTCLHAVAALAELQGGAGSAGMMTPRPLARPVSLAALANQQKAVAP